MDFFFRIGLVWVVLVLISVLLYILGRIEKKKNSPILFLVSYMALRYDPLDTYHVSEERKKVEAKNGEEAIEKVKELLKLEADLEAKDFGIIRSQFMGFEVRKL